MCGKEWQCNQFCGTAYGDCNDWWYVHICTFLSIYVAIYDAICWYAGLLYKKLLLLLSTKLQTEHGIAR